VFSFLLPVTPHRFPSLVRVSRGRKAGGQSPCIMEIRGFSFLSCQLPHPHSQKELGRMCLITENHNQQILTGPLSSLSCCHSSLSDTGWVSPLSQENWTGLYTGLRKGRSRGSHEPLYLPSAPVSVRVKRPGPWPPRLGKQHCLVFATQPSWVCSTPRFYCNLFVL
jgi:hypothetical protein